MTRDGRGQSASNRTSTVDELLSSVTRWATTRPAIHGIALAGSWARGDARPDSDVDLILLVDDPASLLDAGGMAIADELGLQGPQAVEEWGALIALRGRLRNGLELEVGIVSLGWAATDPIDPGTRAVVADGFRALHDPYGILADLIYATDRS